jgi:hypothetical protein
MKRFILSIIIILTFSVVPASAEWDFHFFGIKVNDLEGRNWAPVIIGGVTSYVTHEAGHYVAAELTGMDASVKWDSGIVIWADEYDDKSDSAKRFFHAGGFLAQTLVGSIITAVPYTRHSDFAVGFTGFSFVENTMYGITGGLMVSEYSDVHNLDDLGWNGAGFALGNGLVNGVLLYINLNKIDD